jgi:hypothetical protein
MGTAILKGNGRASFPLILIMADDNFWQQFANLMTTVTSLNITVARMDERQKVMADDVTHLLKLEEARATQRQSDLDWRRDVEDRLKKLEGSGIAAWSWKKIAQAAALVSVCGVLLGAMFELARWFASHWK